MNSISNDSDALEEKNPVALLGRNLLAGNFLPHSDYLDISDYPSNQTRQWTIPIYEGCSNGPIFKRFCYCHVWFPEGMYIYIYIRVNYNNSLTWISRPFGDEFPISKPWFPGFGRDVRSLSRPFANTQVLALTDFARRIRVEVLPEPPVLHIWNCAVTE